MRSVLKIIKSTEAQEVAGITIQRPFPTPELTQINPFLLMDEVGPIQFSPGEAQGSPNLLHAGFESLGYIIEGGLLHEDSEGSSIALHRGDLLRVTAGRGVVESKLPSKNIVDEGGVIHVLRIWINLPKNKRMITANYQATPSAAIPMKKNASGVILKVFSGDLDSLHGPVKVETPLIFAHLSLPPKTIWSAGEFNKNWTTLAYVLSGNGRAAGARRIESADLVQFSNEDGQIQFENTSPDRVLSLFVLSGKPIQEIAKSTKNVPSWENL